MKRKLHRMNLKGNIVIVDESGFSPLRDKDGFRKIGKYTADFIDT